MGGSTLTHAAMRSSTSVRANDRTSPSTGNVVRTITEAAVTSGIFSLVLAQKFLYSPAKFATLPLERERRATKTDGAYDARGNCPTRPSACAVFAGLRRRRSCRRRHRRRKGPPVTDQGAPRF